MKRSAMITWDQVRVGGLILVAVAILGAAAYTLGRAANLFKLSQPRSDLRPLLPIDLL